MLIEDAEIGSGRMSTIESVKFASLKCGEIFCENHPWYWRAKGRLATDVVDGLETIDIDNPL